jgi:hypothetical protein
MSEGNFRATLRVLSEAQIEFILVGGLAAVYNGAPLNTFDVDVVHRRTPENIAHLLAVLDALDAVFRIQPYRRLRPNESHLSGNGHLNLITRLGPLDVLCTIGYDLGYDDLLGHTRDMEIGDGLRVRVLNLEKLIELKEHLSGEKDRAALPLLRAVLAEKRKTGAK